MDETGYLDALQEPMEAIGLGQEANAGRFCGHCYARLSDSKPGKGGRDLSSRCALCDRSTESVKPVAGVPAEVLALYMAKRKREGLVVNSFALFGIFLSMVLSALLWFLLPSGWFDILAFAMLVVGSYYLARIFGLWIGASIGYNSGRRVRDQRWNQFLAQRALASPPSDAATPVKRRTSGSARHE